MIALAVVVFFGANFFFSRTTVGSFSSWWVRGRRVGLVVDRELDIDVFHSERNNLRLLRPRLLRARRTKSFLTMIALHPTSPQWRQLVQHRIFRPHHRHGDHLVFRILSRPARPLSTGGLVSLAARRRFRPLHALHLGRERRPVRRKLVRLRFWLGLLLHDFFLLHLHLLYDLALVRFPPEQNLRDVQLFDLPALPAPPPEFLVVQRLAFFCSFHVLLHERNGEVEIQLLRTHQFIAVRGGLHVLRGFFSIRRILSQDPRFRLPHFTQQPTTGGRGPLPGLVP